MSKREPLIRSARGKPSPALASTFGRELDVVVFGATGFTGKQAARELCKHAPADLRIGIAGRDAAKLKRVAESLPREVITIVADSTDTRAIRRMAERTQVLITTAGPYVRYGTPVLEACVQSKTHYADITGEAPWVRSMIDRFHAQAAVDGTKIIPFCGYDSVPSDIGTLLAVDALKQRGEATLQVEGFHTMKGGFNGGTLATMMTLGDPALADLFADPFALNPGFNPPEDVRKSSRDVTAVRQHEITKRWLAPFMMGTINTRVVRRSAELAGYGSHFRYNEYHRTGSRMEAYAIAAGLAGVFGLAQRPLGRKVIEALGPKPGEGPSERTMDQGFFKSEFLGRGEGGTHVTTEVSGSGDPGNRATVTFLTAGALALALDFDKLPQNSGVLTPALALGLPYADRLRARGIKCEIVK